MFGLPVPSAVLPAFGARRRRGGPRAASVGDERVASRRRRPAGSGRRRSALRRAARSRPGIGGGSKLFDLAVAEAHERGRRGC